MKKKFKNSFDSKSDLKVGENNYKIFHLLKLEEMGLTNISRLPYSIRVLLENTLRNEDGRLVSEQDVKNLAGYDAKNILYQSSLLSLRSLAKQSYSHPL